MVRPVPDPPSHAAITPAARHITPNRAMARSSSFQCLWPAISAHAMSEIIGHAR